MGHSNNSIPVDAHLLKLVVSTNCPIIGEHVALSFMAQWVTMWNYHKHDEMKLFAKFKNILWSGFRTTLNFSSACVLLYKQTNTQNHNHYNLVLSEKLGMREYLNDKSKLDLGLGKTSHNKGQKKVSHFVPFYFKIIVSKSWLWWTRLQLLALSFTQA